MIEGALDLYDPKEDMPLYIQIVYRSFLYENIFGISTPILPKRTVLLPLLTVPINSYEKKSLHSIFRHVKLEGKKSRNNYKTSGVRIDE